MVSKMSECPICGKRTENLSRIEIEDAVLDVCENCVKFGKRIEARAGQRAFKNAIVLDELSAGMADEEFVFASDYGTRIKKARESLGLTRDDFAKRINERESVIRRLESQSMEPDEALTKKIESSLKIKLRESKPQED